MKAIDRPFLRPSSPEISNYKVINSAAMKPGDKRMRFGRLPKEEIITSKQLQIENKILEEKLAAIKKFTEEERKKSEAKASTQGSSSKGFAIRDLKKISLRPTERDLADQAKELAVVQQGFAKRGIRAYEEVVKNRKLSKDQPAVVKEKASDDLCQLLESLNMMRFLPDFQKQGIYNVDQLRRAEINKMGLLPGFEIKLTKKLVELRTPAAEAKQPVVIQECQQPISDEDEDFLTKKSVPLEKPRRYRAILSRHKTLHEDSTMSDLKAKTNESIPCKVKQEDFGCGPADQEDKKPKISCWTCLIILGSDKKVARHPILEGKVVVVLLDILFC